MKMLERASRPPGTPVGHDVLIALTMAIALSLTGMTAWMWSSR
jgi:hypothetical protein